MRGCQVDVAKLVVVLIDDDHPVRRLNKKVWLIESTDEKCDAANRPAVDPKAWRFPRRHELVAFSQCLARPGLKDGVAQVRQRHRNLAAGSAEFVIADAGVRR